jgi:arylformamidase
MIYDITPPLTESFEVWPGDAPLSRQIIADLRDGAKTTCSTLRATVHLGAHADAPNHYGLSADGIGEQPLEPYLGRCQVITVQVGRRGLIGPDTVSVPIEAERVLFHTGTFPDPAVFTEDFAALSPELVESLARQGVKLVGIDTPSVDPFDTENLPSHRMLLKHGMANLERLVLSGVPDGFYELVALPLRLMGFDASPVRAILRTMD